MQVRRRFLGGATVGWLLVCSCGSTPGDATSDEVADGGDGNSDETTDGESGSPDDGGQDTSVETSDDDGSTGDGDSEDDGSCYTDERPDCSLLSPTKLTVTGTTPLGDVPNIYAAYGWSTWCYNKPRIVILDQPDLERWTTDEELPNPSFAAYAIRDNPFEKLCEPWQGTYEARVRVGMNEYQWEEADGIMAIESPIQFYETWATTRVELTVPGWSLTISGELPYCAAADDPDFPCE